MARFHYRYVVRDAYGYAIQNAKVNVYQPDTTTNFSGSAYDAASAGSAVTNPFTTNDQGEIEAWFDTTQLVDIQVDDNSDAAYRAVEGSSNTISFSTFTEEDEVIGNYVSFDYPPSEGRTTADVGTNDNPARADHKHPFAAADGITSKWTKSTTTEEAIGSIGLQTDADALSAGSMFRITLKGYQTNGTTACTYTFRVRWGGSSGVQVGSDLALVGTTTAHTDNPVQLEFLMTVQSIGGTGTATGSWSGQECITTASANTPKLVLDVQDAAATIDTTAITSLVMTLELSTVTGSPNFEVDNLLIEQVA